MQHRRHLACVDWTMCPQEALHDDLSDFIASCQRRDEKIIVCIDLNKDTNRSNSPLQKTLIWNNKLVNVLTARHNIPTPPTHNRGSATIDSIYVSELLTSVNNAGWLQFSEGIDDHRIAYINIDVNLLIGKQRQEISRKSSRRLQTTNESSTRTYVKLCEAGFKKRGIVERICRFQEQAPFLLKK